MKSRCRTIGLLSLIILSNSCISTSHSGEYPVPDEVKPVIPQSEEIVYTSPGGYEIHLTQYTFLRFYKEEVWESDPYSQILGDFEHITKVYQSDSMRIGYELYASTAVWDNEIRLKLEVLHKANDLTISLNEPVINYQQELFPYWEYTDSIVLNGQFYYNVYSTETGINHLYYQMNNVLISFTLAGRQWYLRQN